MRLRLSELCLGTVISIAIAAGPAWAQSAGDDGAAQSAPTTISEQPAAASAEILTEYGAGLRLRSVHVPQSILELFVDRAAGGASNVGIGVELTRRRGTVELQLGLEFEHLTLDEGTWIKSGEPVPTYQADYIVSPEHAPNGEKLGWFTLEFTFINHAPIHKNVSVRYGGGAGLGILTGALYRYDVMCSAGATNDNPEPGCRPSQLGGTASGSGPVKYDLPPVFPVVNAIVGVQIKPMEKLVINVETGIRTVPFFGVTTGYYF